MMTAQSGDSRVPFPRIPTAADLLYSVMWLLFTVAQGSQCVEGLSGVLLASNREDPRVDVQIALPRRLSG